MAAEFGFNYVPLTLLVNEGGRLVRGPTGTNIDKGSDSEEIANWLRTGLIETSPEPVEAVAFKAPEARLQFEAAAVTIANQDSETALDLLNGALAFDTKNWLIRKQIWALENPDRFYEGPIDFDWQQQQIQKDPVP